VREATAIYTDDAGLRNVATALNIEVISVADMPLPAETAQGVLPLKTVDELANEPTLEEIEEARDAETS
jgi:rRNA maturation endonuclease Nob1